MPTIQVRTDENIKSASSTLFEQLGMTMSEAINLFLRQSVMRGGIPFSLTLNSNNELIKTQNISTNNKEIFENEILLDAIKRYKSINGNINFDISKIEPFIKVLEKLDSIKNLRLTLQEKAVKARLNFKDIDFVIDYNYDEPENIFILSRNNGKLIVKDCMLTEITTTLESF